MFNLPPAPPNMVLPSPPPPASSRLGDPNQLSPSLGSLSLLRPMVTFTGDPGVTGTPLAQASAPPPPPEELPPAGDPEAPPAPTHTTLTARTPGGGVNCVIPGVVNSAWPGGGAGSGGGGAGVGEAREDT
jgi:hypothetical protein